MARADIGGNWYGMMVCHPHRGVIYVSFDGEDGSYAGQWDFPNVAQGAAKKGRFKATRFANWLFIRIVTRPLSNVHCRLTLVESCGESMIFGAIPLPGADFPFATVTLFRHKPPEEEMRGICPIRFRRTKA